MIDRFHTDKARKCRQRMHALWEAFVAADIADHQETAKRYAQEHHEAYLEHKKVVWGES